MKPSARAFLTEVVGIVKNASRTPEDVSRYRRRPKDATATVGMPGENISTLTRLIQPRSNCTAMIRYSKSLYRQRNCIERVLGHLKIIGAVATRYDQFADSFLGIGSARYWIKTVHEALLGFEDILIL